MMLFIILLPFGVIEYFGIFEVPLVVAISACFLLIEKMAIHLQDPFENKPTDTPMTAIATGIEKTLLQLYTTDISSPFETHLRKVTSDVSKGKVVAYKTSGQAFEHPGDMVRKKQPAEKLYYVM